MDAGILYSVVAAVVWGGYLFALKRYFDDCPATVLTVSVNAFAIALYLPVAAATLSTADLPAASTIGPADVGVVALTIVGVAVAFVVFLRALDVGEVSYVAPINKLVPVFVLPIEIGLLGEHLAPPELAGVVVATCAVYVANYEPGSLFGPFRRAATTRAAQLALVSAAAYAVSDVGKRLVLQELAVPVQAWVLLLLSGVLVVLLPLAVRDWPADGVRADLPKFAVAGAVVAGAEHVTSLAFALVPASIASPVVNTQAVVAVVLGGVLLGEDAFRVRLVAAVLAVAGVGLIAA